MRKLLITLCLLVISSVSAHAAVIPNNIETYIKKEIPKADIRFDGLITMPNNYVYLPLFPALIKTPEKISISKTYPANKTLKDYPDVVVFNTDFVLLKVLSSSDGKKTITRFDVPPSEIKTGLLPQNLLVPKGFVVPDNVKGIIGGLQIATAQDKGLKVKSELPQAVIVQNTVKKDNVAETILPLKDKMFYVITCFSKNIHVVPSDKTEPIYALDQESVPIDIKQFDNKFLLVTMFFNKTLDVISLSDDAVIKRIELPSQPEQIIMDLVNKKAYISSSEASCLYLIDLTTMQLKQKIQINGMCEKFYLTQDSSKLIYTDKKTNNVWLIELDNDFTITDVGQFPNVSAIAFAQNKIYLTSRTKNRLAIVDFTTMGLIEELDLPAKPLDLLTYKNNLFILSAQDNVISILDTVSDSITQTLYLNTKGFATKMQRLDSSAFAIVTDAKAGKYSVMNLDKKQIVKNNPINIPVGSLAIVNATKKTGK